MDNKRVSIQNPQIQIANALFEQIEIMNINNKFRKQKLYKFKQYKKADTQKSNYIIKAIEKV